MDANTASLRSAAPQWSLAGDKQLLDILQNIHQSLVTRCQEVNQKLDEMVTALDGASVDLQNVNNKFMALSNSQFIESRVYDDDVDVAAPEQPKEPMKPSTPPSQDLDQLKHSIRALESAHELIEILDSESDTADSEDEDLARTVLKPVDVYAHRPLPYIIGSQAWRNKWHAGLHPEDSDSDNSGSACDPDSDSEPELKPEVATPQPHVREIEESTASSEMPSEQASTAGSLPAAAKPSPSDVAAELARRLGGHPPKLPVEEVEYSPPSPMTKKVYRPDQPSAGTVFCDEPPPLDHYQSESEPEGDIFAELHKSRPYDRGDRGQSRAAEELFGGLGEVEGGDIFSDFREPPPIKKSTLFEDEPEPELFSTPAANTSGPPSQGSETRPDVGAVKKPVGGISLFGNNKGAESIGAAILRRNQRQSSEEDSDTTPPESKDSAPKTKEKDIFDDLFAKSEREQKNRERKKEPIKKEVPKVDTPKEVVKPKIDLFSDNIFDDIDDIFTSNINTVAKKDYKNDKPLFDDVDDLFSDIAVSKETKTSTKSSKQKSIFDSDDDLFAEKEPEPILPRSKPKENLNKNQFGNVDDIFSDIVQSKDVDHKSNVVNVAAHEITRSHVFDDNNVSNQTQGKDLENSRIDTKNKASVVNDQNNLNDRGSNNNIEKSTKSLFDDDDDDELFGKDNKKSSSSDENSNIVANAPNEVKIGQFLSNNKKKSSLFDDDSDENDLFGTSATKSRLNKENVAKSTETIKPLDNKKVAENKENHNNVPKRSLFDDDIEDEDIFATTSANNNTSVNRTNVSNDLKSGSLFEDDIDDLFSKKDMLATVARSQDSKPIVEQNTTVAKPVALDNERKNSENTEISSSAEQQTTFDNDSSIIEKGEKPIITQKPIMNDQKPTVSEQKPMIHSKPEMKPKEEHNEPKTKDEKPILIEQKDRESNIVSKDELDINSTSVVATESYTVDSKNSIEVDNNIKHETTINTEDDLFTPKQENNVENRPIEYKIPDLDEKTPDNDTLFSEPKDALFSTPAVFDDIFSEPPAFEKSSEPKKSKNVNALFDDDSEDEALFFKKNDATLDDKPDLNEDTKNDALFGIFHDEPPAIEVDLSQKAGKSDLNDDFLKSDSDDDLFTIKSKKETAKTADKSHVIAKDKSQDKPDVNITGPGIEETDTVAKSSPVLDKAEIFEQKSKSEQKSPDSDTKKVGKLKTMNFNIDVSTLLPGASPKKKAVEQTDGQAISTKSDENIHTDKDSAKKSAGDVQILSAKSQEDLHKKEKIEPSVLKSVSFDGEPDANILDNKLSKERAKIQVKRRPSTRRARKEAVKKSAIDIADDSTDNSSSIDDPRPPRAKVRSEIKKADNEPKIEAGIEKPVEVIEKKHNVIQILDDISQLKTPVDEVKAMTPESNTKESIDTTDAKTHQNNDIKSDIVPKLENLQTQSKLEPEYRRPENKNVTSKIVYILNDEDIFSNPSIEKPQKSKVLNIVDDDDDLFKNVTKSNVNIAGINTLGNTYKEMASEIEKEVKSTIQKQTEVDSSLIFKEPTNLDSQKAQSSDVNKSSQSKVDSNTYNIDSNRSDSMKIDIKPKKSLFDDLSDDDDELFNSNKIIKPKAKNILDSDSEDDLFGGHKKETKDSNKASVGETKDAKPKVEVKSSLFGDDDDDDLFGVKVKSNVASSSNPSRVVKESSSRPSQLVFDDPLSLLGGDED